MIRRFVYAFMIGCLLFSAPAQAGGGQVIIRDAEIEGYLKSWTRPLMSAAGLDPESVKIVLVQSPEINAFVAGGQNIFLYTGLLLKSENAGEVAGVIGHELGHIAGGHLVRTADAMENASYEAVIGTLLGLGAAIASGDSRAAAVGVAGGQTLAQRNFLSHSRAQESAADQAAIRFFKSAGMNPSGLISFMDKIADQDLLPASQQNEYVQTHPISRDRVTALSGSLSDSPLLGRPLPPEWADQHARMKAKLIAFIMPQQVPFVYSDQDSGTIPTYARAIAAYRENHVDAALRLSDTLIAREPKNPYFQELKGQMLFEFGRVRDSIPVYEKAVALAPDEALLRLALAGALVEGGGKDPGTLDRARTQLERVRLSEPRTPRVFRLLATLYGRQGNEPMARAMLAEEALLQGRMDDARFLARGALETLPAGSPQRRATQDLLDQLDQKDADKRDEDPPGAAR